MDWKIIAILILLFLSGFAISLAAYVIGVFHIDIEVAVALIGGHNPVLDAIMAAVSFLGDRFVPVILVATVAAICAVKKKWVDTVFVALTLISSAAIAGTLKAIIGRPRPPGFSLDPYDLFQPFNQYSYPSGHVLFFVIFFGFSGFLAWNYLTGWKRWLSLITCISLITLIGPSRIYLGEHWISDVIGSYIIGTFFLIILILLYMLTESRNVKILKNMGNGTGKI
ncbi:MAG TPA: phosphatase PAP2 family protein [Methanoregulaceae archaeon]|nr:phosphatase PAP2 family protein [Methanoregulaceae archaeon]